VDREERARPWGPGIGRPERVLADVAAEAELHRAGDPAFEGGVDSVTWSMWRAYLRDARDWAAEQR
jgi:hypothetical protein